MKFADEKIYFKSHRRHISYGIFLLLIICGIVLGTALIGTTDNLVPYRRLLFTHNIFKTNDEVSVIVQFFRSFLPLLFILLLQLFLGYFAFGQIIAILTAVYRGVVSGISSAFIYLTLGVKGIFAVVVTVLPFALSTAMLIALSTRESVKMSGQVADYSFFGRAGSNLDNKIYILKFAVLMVFALGLSIIDIIIMYLTDKIFF